jgi:hypothetical protein
VPDHYAPNAFRKGELSVGFVKGFSAFSVSEGGLHWEIHPETAGEPCRGAGVLRGWNDVKAQQNRSRLLYWTCADLFQTCGRLRSSQPTNAAKDGRGEPGFVFGEPGFFVP